jgi:hypothetical protein
LTTVSSTTPNARFVVHYNETFGEPVTRTLAPNTSYDAMYVLGYASFALGAEKVDGPALSRAIERLLPPGPAVEVGPSGILVAFDALAKGGHIDLSGATGPLDFDTSTGEAPLDLAVLCATVDARGDADEAIESGLVYDAKAARLTGEIACP